MILTNLNGWAVRSVIEWWFINTSGKWAWNKLIWLKYCISLYFRVQLFSRICPRETFRQFLFSQVVMSSSWVQVVMRHFACFYFRVCEFIREIRENKCLAKISTYTVIITKSWAFLLETLSLFKPIVREEMTMFSDFEYGFTEGFHWFRGILRQFQLLINKKGRDGLEICWEKLNFILHRQCNNWVEVFDFLFF